MFDPSRKDNRNRSLLSWGGAKIEPANGEALARTPPRPKPKTEAVSAAEVPARDAFRLPAGRTKERHAGHSVDAGMRETPRPAPHPREAPDDPYWRPMIDPMYIFRALASSKRLIVIATVAGAVAGVLIALATPKEYYASTQILFDPRRLQLSDQDLTADNLPSDATLALIENQVGIIRSTTVLDKVVEELDLADDPEFNGQGGGILGILMNPRALLSFGGGSEGGDKTTAIAIQNLAEKLEVFRNESTFIINIGALTQDADKSALIANTTAEIYLTQTGALLRQTADRATSELTDQLDELKAAVEVAERAVVDYKAEHDIVDAQGRLIADDEIVRLSEQLSTARARTAELNARAATASDLDVENVLGGALPEQVSSPVMTELLAQYSRLQQDADRAAVRLGPRHPDNLTLQAELDGVRGAMAGELRRVNASMQVELQRAVELEQDLAARLARLKAQNAGREGEYVTLRELQREAEARRTVYESFLLRARQTGQQRSLNTANASVISTAHPPLVPTGPSRTSIAITGTILGFLAGIAIAAGRGAFESLRENMAGGRSSAPGQGGAVYRDSYRRDDEESAGDDEEFDPPPEGPGGRSRRRYGETMAAADAPHGTAPAVPAREHPAVSGTLPSVPRLPANDAPPIVHDVPGEPSPVDRLCDSLRAFRRDVDDLAERRARRRA